MLFNAHLVDEALQVLARYGAACRIIAGATDIMVGSRQDLTADSHWLDISGLTAFSGIRRVDGWVRIGALTTCRTLTRHTTILQHYPMLAASAAETGSYAIQNRATLGGNIANASPAADNPPVLLAYGAEIELTSLHGKRRLPYAEFHLGYRRTAQKADELISALYLPVDTGRPVTTFYQKVGTRNAQAISKVSVAAWIARKNDGAITTARFGLASVGPTPQTLPTLSAWLSAHGTVPEPRLLNDLVATDIHPQDDIRSTRAYRLHVACSLIARALNPPAPMPRSL